MFTVYYATVLNGSKRLPKILQLLERWDGTEMKRESTLWTEREQILNPNVW
jgi:hypothetical protein